MLSKLAVKSKSPHKSTPKSPPKSPSKSPPKSPSKSPPKSPRKQSKVPSKERKSKAKQKSSGAKAIDCPSVEKPKKKEAPPQAEEVECNRPKFYRSPEEKRIYLEQQVVPVLMEGMLAVAREQPRDPIGYLEKFWLQDKQRCDIQLPQNIL